MFMCAKHGSLCWYLLLLLNEKRWVYVYMRIHIHKRICIYRCIYIYSIYWYILRLLKEDLRQVCILMCIYSTYTGTSFGSSSKILRQLPEPLFLGRGSSRRSAVLAGCSFRARWTQSLALAARLGACTWESALPVVKLRIASFICNMCIYVCIRVCMYVYIPGKSFTFFFQG